METTISKQQSIHVSAKSETVSASTNSKFWEYVEFQRYGIIGMLIAVIGCMGGFAAAYGAGANEYKIALVAFPTILSLAFMLAVMPMRLIVWASSIALIIDIALLIFQ